MPSPRTLITSAKFSSHVMLRSIGFLESLQGQAFGTLLKQGMLDYWLAVEGREVARTETMLYLFTTIKDWWKEYLSAHRNTPAQISPTGELQWLEPSTYRQYKEFVSSFKPTGVSTPPKLLYRAAACVALNEMENNAYYAWNDTEFAARIARVLLNNTTQRVLASLATDEFMEISDPANHWATSLLRDVELDASSDFCKPLINGSFEFQGRPCWQEKAPVAAIPSGIKFTPTGILDWSRTDWSNPCASEQAAPEEKAIDPAEAQNRRTRSEESVKTLQAVSRTSAMQIDCSCTTSQFTHDQVGKAVSRYDFEISIQADAGNLLRTESPWGLLPYGPIGAYARVYGIAVWPVLGAGFSLDKSVPSGKDLDASTSRSRGVSSSVSNEESSTLSSNVDANAGSQSSAKEGSSKTRGGGVSAGFSQTRGITRTDSTDESLQVSIPHVDFLNHRIESREGTIAPLIVFRMAPPFEPDLNASRVVQFCKDLALKRMDETYTQKELVNGTQGVENFFDDSAQLGPVTLQPPRDSSIECFQQTCAFSFSRDDERFGAFFSGSQVRFRVQFIVGVAHAHASNEIDPPKVKDFGAKLTDYVLGQKDDSMEKMARGLPGRENVFMRDFIFDLVIDVP